MALRPVFTRWTSQPQQPAQPSPEFRWDVLINQAFPSLNVPNLKPVTPRGTAAVGEGGRWQNWHGVNALEQIEAPLPTTSTGYTMLWVGPMQVASTGTGVNIIRTTGGGFRFEPYTTAGGAWMTATHTGVAALNPPGPWSYSHDSRPWAVIISYDGTTASFEVKTPDGEFGAATTTAGMNAGTGTIDLSTTSGVFGAYLVGYAARPMPSALRRQILDNPWSTFQKKTTVAWSVSSGITGSVAYTNADDTSSASGSTTIVGTVSVTNADDTSSASGSTTITGTVSYTNLDDTSSASGSTTIIGTVSVTNADDTSTASGTVGGGVSGTVAYINLNDTSSASGFTTIVGTVSVTNNNDISTASGFVAVIGTSNTTNNNDICTASGTSGNNNAVRVTLSFSSRSSSFNMSSKKATIVSLKTPTVKLKLRNS